MKLNLLMLDLETARQHCDSTYQEIWDDLRDRLVQAMELAAHNDAPCIEFSMEGHLFAAFAVVR